MSRQELQGKVARLPTGVTLGVPKSPVEKHVFRWKGNCWMCDICLLRKFNPSTASCRPCPGPPPFKGLLRDCRGHNLYIASTAVNGVILYCNRCFHYASPHPRNLLRQCRGLPVVSKSFKGRTSQSSEKFYLSRSKHPVSHLRLCRPVAVHDLN